jgi:5'-nucleotidase
VGESVGISGTVGAAMEAASQGIPAIAVSLQLRDESLVYSYSEEIDFSTAAYFTAYFARQILEKHLPQDVDMLKIDVPYDATPQTDWRITRLGRHRYYMPQLERKGEWNEPGRIGFKRVTIQPGDSPTDTDIYVINIEKKVSVTPLSLDTTSRVRFDDFDQYLRGTKK